MPEAPMGTRRMYFAAAGAGNYLYAMGGCDTDGCATNSVEVRGSLFFCALFLSRCCLPSSRALSFLFSAARVVSCLCGIVYTQDCRNAMQCGVVARRELAAFNL